MIEDATRTPAPAAAGAAAPRLGLLIVDKPGGMTSHDVIDIVRRRFRERAAGHLGTLDPAATGLLAVALGPATRCASVWQGGEKTYDAVLRFGIATTTQDMTGEVTGTWPVAIDAAAIRAATSAFTGDVMQVPPMVSAVRVGGERLYRLARRGITVDRDPRPVHVASWDWLAFDLPLARFRVRCSGGTYVRTLAHDLGAALGCGAALESLRRSRSEPFDLARAVTTRELQTLDPEDCWERAGIPLDRALGVLPALALDAAETLTLGCGGAIPLTAARAAALPLGAGPRSIVFRDLGGAALGLGEVAADGGAGTARPQVVFPWVVRDGRPEV